MRFCSVENCNRNVMARGWCSCHYQRWQSTGDPSGLRQEQHKMSRSSEYKTWHGLKRRCLDPNSREYIYYGGRGITVCSYWQEAFTNFYGDVGDRPEGTSLDRIDNDGHYSCGHCHECLVNAWPKNWRWATKSVQCRNQRFRQNETGYPGVVKSKNKFVAQIYIDNRNHHLGYFDTPEEASKAYLNKRRELLNG